MFLCFLVLAAGQVITIVKLQNLAKKDNSQMQENQERLENCGIVKVTYYTNLKSMTDDTPNTAAWNDDIREGMIAVSPDLLDFVYYNDCVFIEFDGKKTAFVVADKMHPKNKRTVDIFIEVSTFDEKDVKHFKDIVLGVDFIYMPIDKVWIRKEDFQKLNTHFYSRMFVKL